MTTSAQPAPNASSRHSKIEIKGQNYDRQDGFASKGIMSAASARNSGADDAGPADITASQKILSATTGSLLTGLTMTPLDVVRVRLQAQRVAQVSAAASLSPSTLPGFTKRVVSHPIAFHPSKLGVTTCCRDVFFMHNNAEMCVVEGTTRSLRGAVAECAIEQTQRRIFTSTLDALRKISRNEGLPTLWRGLSPTLVMAIPANTIYFTGYEWLRYNPQSPVQRNLWISRDDGAPIIAGMVARAFSATAVGPLELFRTRLQASQGTPDGRSGHLAATFRGIVDMVRTYGYASLWRGLTITLWRDVPFSGMYWWGYETIRARLTDVRERSHRARNSDVEPQQQQEDKSEESESRTARGRARRLAQNRATYAETFADSFIAGAASGALACLVTMPFDVGKTRMQVYKCEPASAAAPATPTAAEQQTIWRLLRHIYASEGFGGLFRGWIPRMIKVAPACAIMISSFEMGKSVFRGINERGREREGKTKSQ